MHDWWYGTKSGKPASMGVISNGNQYGVPHDLIFSFTLNNNNDVELTINNNSLNDFQKAKLEASWNELLDERKIALDF